MVMIMEVKRSSSCVLLVLLLIGLILTSCFSIFSNGATFLPQEEVETLKVIAKKLGKEDWDFSADPCNDWKRVKTGFDDDDLRKENHVNCTCSPPSISSNRTVCHVEAIVLKAESLQGVLPSEFVKLPYLKIFDLTRNYLNGTIPKEWGSMKSITKISVLGNRLTGTIPKEIGNLLTLFDLDLEGNYFSGSLPMELGNLTGIGRIVLNSNNFTGELPATLSKLINLIDFRISDNQFTGKIPNFIQNWKMLTKLAMQASGLEGPIPSSISLLENLFDLRISDIKGTQTGFPSLDRMGSMRTLILRSCNISGTIPYYIWTFTDLKSLDLSFNKLTGSIPSNYSLPTTAESVYLTSNLLTGIVPNWIDKIKSVDLSYNSLKFDSDTPRCQQGNVNLFGSPSLKNYSGNIAPCLKSKTCSSSSSSVHINCGGNKVTIDGNIEYQEDSDSSGASMSYEIENSNWLVSNTGNFMDANGKYIATNKSKLSMGNAELYKEARISPLSLTYYGFCLINGNYTVSLHFAEIIITNTKTYGSLGRRRFDIFVQGTLVWKDFDIVDEAGGAGKAVIKNFTAIVTHATLEIRFYWAGKGTTATPVRGTYGPLISAISVTSDFIDRSGDKKIPRGAIFGIVASAVVCLILMILGVLWWKECRKDAMNEELRGLDLSAGSFTLRQIKAATNNFDKENKIGEGGFGPVYKGRLSGGKIIAVKQLSSKSKQGNREFVNEIGMISAIQHPNLVKLYGCCTEGNQLLVIYEYMENNSLARALFSPEESGLDLDWSTRHKICVGIARGLAYLHEESRLKIVHRDIKGTNILLDKDLNPKISDFGLAKLDEEENTHISTRIAGTIGYMAPEYALRGYLTDKADVYSFGIVALEIVSGRSNTSNLASEERVYLLDWALALHGRGNLMELVDPRLGSEFDEEQVLGMINVALMCTNKSSTLRPTMSAVVSMLEGRTSVGDFVSTSSKSFDDSKLKAILDYHEENQDTISKTKPIPVDASGSSTSSIYETRTELSISGVDLYPLIPDSEQSMGIITE